jgi:hypothetical protein
MIAAAADAAVATAAIQMLLWLCWCCCGYVNAAAAILMVQMSPNVLLSFTPSQ